MSECLSSECWRRRKEMKGLDNSCQDTLKWKNCGNKNILAIEQVSGEHQLQYFCYEEMCNIDEGVHSEAHLIFAKAQKLPPFKHHSYLNIAIKARLHYLKAVKCRSLWNSVTATVMWRLSPSINITLNPQC